MDTDVQPDVLRDLREMADHNRWPDCDVATLREAIIEIERLRTKALRKRPVAFRVPDGPTTWTLYQNEEAARNEADARGVEYQGLYVRESRHER